MRRTFALASLLLLASTFAFAENATRSFEGTYTATITKIPVDAGVLNVWIPIPTTREDQQITDVKIDSAYSWKRMREKEFGDEYIVATIPAPQTGEFTVKVTFRATRHNVAYSDLANVTLSKRELARALRADRLVTISPRIVKLADQITAGKTNVTDQARAIYDYLASTMKYDKTIPGWGNGDTERACDIKAGNCTDFHSFFMSLARAKGIPARFLIGFPLPAASGKSPGYHCWAEFYDGHAWVPIDASEASKSTDPAVRAFLFGNLGADRIEFTRGRDLTLNPPTSEPVNYFLYPRAEAKGKVVGTPSISLEVRDINTGGTPAAASGGR
ncbi:MAG TPA: transglutaminase-like domain-containing protein [Thermoanaerobaculia bacterium]|nr:transglutaminase-like domain-containing protein [Thermoanaerobaculia bacterium]